MAIEFKASPMRPAVCVRSPCKRPAMFAGDRVGRLVVAARIERIMGRQAGNGSGSASGAANLPPAPSRKIGRGRFRPLGQRRFELGPASPSGASCPLDRRGGHFDQRGRVALAAIEPVLGHVVEERVQPVVIALRDRVELVVVALGSSRSSGPATPCRSCSRGRRCRP